MNYIEREIEKDVRRRLHSGKAIVVYGPRQSGKTTMVRHLVEDRMDDVLWLNGDTLDTRDRLERMTPSRWKMLLGHKKILVLDEAQRVNDVGLAIKILVDEIPQVQVIVTGSSSFELANRTAEPLTGRKFQYTLLPLSFREIAAHNGLLSELEMREQRLLYGGYPDIVSHQPEAERLLRDLSDSYLFRDLLSFDGMRKATTLDRLVKALALQIGSEVNLNELSGLVGISRATTEKYIDLLEKSFVVFSLPSFSGNMRNEIKKGRKIYFHDLGVRNALIGNFCGIESRTDSGAMWENYLVSERLKNTINLAVRPQHFFWRTAAPNSMGIDYLEKDAAGLSAWEFKLNPRSKARIPLSFRNTYDNAKTGIVTPDNYDEFLLGN